PVHIAADRDAGHPGRFSDPIAFLEHGRSLGAAGVQVGIGIRESAEAAKIRQRVADAGMYLEGIVTLPRDDADTTRFDAEVRTAKQAGAEIVRTVMLTGRRYETFATAAAFREFGERSFHSLQLAAPVVTRAEIRLAVENHKDWRVDELLRILARLACDHV